MFQYSCNILVVLLITSEIDNSGHVQIIHVIISRFHDYEKEMVQTVRSRYEILGDSMNGMGTSKQYAILGLGMRAVVLSIALWRNRRKRSCWSVGRMESSGCHWKTSVKVSCTAMFNSMKANAVHPQVYIGLSVSGYSAARCGHCSAARCGHSSSYTGPTARFPDAQWPWSTVLTILKSCYQYTWSPSSSSIVQF